MKVLFDHQIFNFVYGGAPKYFAMLLKYMPHGIWETTCLHPYCEYVKSNNLFKTYPYIFKGQARITDTINKLYTKFRVHEQNFDVFHQTNFGTYCLSDLGSKPMVTTYHDSNMSTYDKHPKIVERQRISLQRANAIICVSENTKNDIINLFNINENKVRVIYHGIEIPIFSLVPKQRLFNFQYILYVGRRSEYKNFNRLIYAFAKLHKIYDNIKLICTSNDFNKEEIQIFKSLNIQNNMIHIHADEQTMNRLYRDALFFIFPSLYEGFGMPILESWSCNCPITISRASCFPEIAGDAALYFNPMEVEDIYKKMIFLIENESLRDSLVQKGKERLKKFSWEKCAKEHILLYKSLLD